MALLPEVLDLFVVVAPSYPRGHALVYLRIDRGPGMPPITVRQWRYSDWTVPLRRSGVDSPALSRLPSELLMEIYTEACNWYQSC